MDKCNIYDFDYKRLSKMDIDDGRTIQDFVDGKNITRKNCTEFVFDHMLPFDNSTFESSIVTDVRIFRKKLFKNYLIHYFLLLFSSTWYVMTVGK